VLSFFTYTYNNRYIPTLLLYFSLYPKRETLSGTLKLKRRERGAVLSLREPASETVIAGESRVSVWPEAIAQINTIGFVKAIKLLFIIHI